VLELGCGYGRILPELAQKAGTIVGIDNSLASLLLARQTLSYLPNCQLVAMDASRLAFRDKCFDCVVCIQNGISAFHVDQKSLIGEAIRVTKVGGTLLFSTYADKFWNERLEWFERQADEGLVGPIDYDRTGNGVIVCQDGFTATTVRPEEFISLSSGFAVETRLEEVDESCLFCRMSVKHHPGRA
jgi:2-polyprenyl-6-hydroxyphenyl methylase/3-demethylubiquinone-9 3-methyltransferase